jgi:hypothetical protein
MQIDSGALAILLIVVAFVVMVLISSICHLANNRWVWRQPKRVKSFVRFVKRNYYSLRHESLNQEVLYELALFTEAPRHKKAKHRLRMKGLIIERSKVFDKLMEVTHAE